MSVLIKGIKMPTRCEDCPVCHYMERGTITVCGCKATMMIRPIDCNSKPYWCPLVEASTPHGRLIDASEVITVQVYEDQYEDYRSASMTIDDMLSQSWIDADAPTIIEAEEGE